jgi:signal transduction histidine kinase
MRERGPEHAPTQRQGDTSSPPGGRDLDHRRALSPTRQAARPDEPAARAVAEADPFGDAESATTRAIAPILERLPVGVLVYRLNQPVYANRPFLNWSGYESIEALAEAGGLDSLLIESGAAAPETGGPFAITSSQGESNPAEARLVQVPWEGESAFAVVLAPETSGDGHTASLVNDLLELAKIEACRVELAFAGVALNELVGQCIALMRRQANRGRIIIRSSLALKLPQVMADARSLRQVVLNLLSNAIKFAGPGGQVIISTTRSEEGDVVLRVRDTGIGLSEQELATAREPLRQIATAAQVGSGSAGLGLPLTTALAEANGARLRIESAPNAGTLVAVIFPGERVVGERGSSG